VKISTWNVNGIRSAINKGLPDWISASNSEIYCFQEVKARAEQVSSGFRELDGYSCFWNPAERPGYSGVVSFSKSQPVEVRYGMGISHFDSEGRVIRMKFPGFFLYNVYFPNGKRNLERVGYKLDFYASLLDECDQLLKVGENIIITGDFNTAHSDIDLANPKENSNFSGFLPEERAWIDIYLSHGFVDAYRERYPARVQYTWWTYRMGARKKNIGWRLDYFLVSRSLMPLVSDVIIYDEITGSDHCPVALLLRI
jgi:exodeoxyribonuclease-3